MKVFRNKKTTKYFALCIVIVIIASACYFAKKAYNARQNWREFKKSIVINNAIDNSILANMFVQQQRCQLDSLPHNVLCIGNSITIHKQSKNVWYSYQGMAASKPEFDYCHILEKMMKQHNPQTNVTPVNIASWERDFSIDIDSLLKDKCVGKDIIIIRIGENVKSCDVPEFADALSNLINYCSQYTNNIVITGQYWPDRQKELAVVTNAWRHNLKYVPIYWIWNLYKEECCPKEGDVLYDTLGQPYKIVGNKINTHPNDNGMELIARSIYNAL